MPIEFHRDGPWELPEGWAWARAGDVLPLEYGKGLPARRRDNSGAVPVYGSAGVVGTHSNALVDEPCLIIARKGSVGAVFEETRPSWPIDTVYFARESPALDRRYAYWFIEFSRLDRLDQSTAVPSLSRDKYNEVSIPIPPIAEQRRIAARIDELFTEIADGEAALSHARADLDTWRRALLKATVTGELTRDWREHSNAGTGADVLANARKERDRKSTSSKKRRFKLIPPSGEISLPDIPENWIWGQLGDFLYDIEAGLNVKAEGRPPREDEVGIVKISAVTWDEFDENESKTLPPEFEVDERDVIRSGDFLISRANTLELVAAPVIVKSCKRRLVLSDKVLRLRLVEGLQRWIELCLKSPLGRQQIEHYASGNQLSMRNITQENIARLAIPIPPKTELEVAVSVYAQSKEDSDDGDVMLRGSTQTVESLRQSVLKAAFAGELVEQDARDEPADRLFARLDNESKVVDGIRSAKTGTSRVSIGAE